MANILITATNEEIKAVEGIVIDAAEWLQAAWNGKVANCIDRVLIEEGNINPHKANEQEKKDWIKNNTFKTRKQKDIDAGL